MLASERSLTYHGDFSRDCVVVGSIDTPNNWSRLPLSQSDGDRLLENGAALIPRLRHAEVLTENIGLRPVRKWGVRIEYEEVTPKLKARNKDSGINDLGKKSQMKLTSLQVLHNYGHGGCGVTLSWGCADEAAKLLEHVLLGHR